MTTLVLYNGQTRIISLNYANYVLANDGLESWSITVTPDDGGLTHSSTRSGKIVVLSLTATSENKQYEVELFAETQTERIQLVCYKVNTLPMPAPSPVVLSLKAGERNAYMLQYDSRLSLSPADEKITTVVATPPENAFVEAYRYAKNAVLLFLGSDAAGESIEIPLKATTNLGREFNDTIRLVVGACSG